MVYTTTELKSRRKIGMATHEYLNIHGWPFRSSSCSSIRLWCIPSNGWVRNCPKSHPQSLGFGAVSIRSTKLISPCGGAIPPRQKMAERTSLYVVLIQHKTETHSFVQIVIFLPSAAFL